MEREWLFSNGIRKGSNNVCAGLLILWLLTNAGSCFHNYNSLYFQVSYCILCFFWLGIVFHGILLMKRFCYRMISAFYKNLYRFCVVIAKTGAGCRRWFISNDFFWLGEGEVSRRTKKSRRKLHCFFSRLGCWNNLNGNQLRIVLQTTL